MDRDMFDFDTTDLTAEEIDEMLDSMTLELAKEIEEDESRTAVINPYKLKSLQVVEQIMRRIAKQNKKVKLSYKLNEPFKSMASVTLTGKNISISDVSRFIKSAELASNFEVYPKADGTVCMTFTFHNMTTPIE